MRPLSDMVAHADGMVTLRCEVCKPKADVQWLKNGVEVVPGRRFSIRADGVERSLTIHRLTREDAGEYACESKDDQTVAALRVDSKYICFPVVPYVKQQVNSPLSLQCLEWWSSSLSSTTLQCWKEKTPLSSVWFPLRMSSWSGAWTMRPSP